MSHPRTEETRLNEGESASGRGGSLVSGSCFGLVVFCLFWVACVLIPLIMSRFLPFQ